MRLHIEGQHTNIPPYLLGWIAERIEDLDASPDNILAARVILTAHKAGERRRQEARVEVVVSDFTPNWLSEAECDNFYPRHYK
jgi:ribosome-associated translation inhibitor RaiA